MVELSVVIPAYNEQNIIEETLSSVKSSVNNFCQSYEIIVVDDGSTDNTAGVVAKMIESEPKIYSHSYSNNKGKGYAVSTGVHLASGDLILFIDADLELGSKSIHRFIDASRSQNADIVIGSKQHPQSDVQYPLFRRILSRSYAGLTKLLFNLPVSDTQVGIKIFRQEVADDLFPRIKTNGYAFDIEVLVLAHQEGYAILEAPVELDFSGESEVDWAAVTNILIKTGRIFTTHRLRPFIRGICDRFQ
jgi:glycosyltransferase involved in cell wall biosynthesis